MAENPFLKYRPNPVLSSPTDPTAAAEEARRQQDQEFEAQRIANEAARLRIAQQQAALQQQLGQMEVQQTQQEVGQQAQEREEMTQARSVEDIRRNLRNDNLLNEINRARGLIGTFSTGNTFGSEFFQGVPVLGQGATDLSGPIDTIKANLSFDRLQEMRADPANKTGGALGAVSERELRLLGSAVSSLNQEMSEEELRRSLATIERHYRNVQALFNGEDPREPEVAEKYGIVFEGGDESGEEPPSGGELTSEGRWEGTDPALRGVNASVRSMIERGRSADEIRDYLNTVQPGLGDRTQDLDRAVNAVRQNPNQELNINLERNWVPNSGAMQAVGEFGMSPMGAALIGAADTASLGFLDNLTDNPEMTRAVMTGVSEENPWPYLGGQVLGGAASGIGLEAALARGGLTGITGARTADALFGAGYGAGMADEPGDSRVASALLGAGSGVVGGMAGRGLARGAGRALTGVQDAAQQTLNRAGVSMTPGQILGGAVKRTEDRLAGLPIVGDAITRRRQEGLEDFNRTAFNQASEALGVPAPANIGGAGIDNLRLARSNRYGELLDNQQFVPDQGLENDIAALLARSSELPEELVPSVVSSLEGRVGNAVEYIGGQDAITGRSFQRSLQGLDRDVRSLMKQNAVRGDDAEAIVHGGREALIDMVGRQAPGVAEELAQINRGNMLMETIRKAVDTARNQGEVITPAQLSNAAAIQARRFGNNQGTTQQPFYELARAGQEVLPSQIPDSGTAGRAIIPYLLLSGGAGAGGYAASEGETAERAGAGAGTAAIAALLASAPYSQTARNTLQRVLLSERPQAVSRAGERLTDMADIAGALAAPVAVGYTGQ